MLRNCIRNKSEPPCKEVELMEANPMFAYVRFPGGKESIVSIKDLSPRPSFHWGTGRFESGSRRLGSGSN